MMQISAFYQRLALEDSTTWVEKTVLYPDCNGINMC